MGDDSVYTSWMYRGMRPPSDSAYFENLSRCVFQSGLNWATIASRWPAFKDAFEGFEITRVAGYGAEDIARLMGDARIIRNRNKILATIHNAREFERIVKENGSVSAWLDSLDKANNYQGVIKRVLQRFKHVGATSVPLWLYSVGEDMTSPHSSSRGSARSRLRHRDNTDVGSINPFKGRLPGHTCGGGGVQTNWPILSLLIHAPPSLFDACASRSHQRLRISFFDQR